MPIATPARPSFSPRSSRCAGALVGASACLLLLTTGSSQAQPSGYPFRPTRDNSDLVAYWYPVRPDSVVLQQTGRTWEFFSLLHVYGAVAGDRFEVAVVARRQRTVLFRRTFVVDKAAPSKDFTYAEVNGYFRIEAKTDYRAERPTEISVAITRGTTRRARTTPCRYHTIKGTIRDIDDQPLRAFLSVGPDEFTSPITAWSDAGGRFSVELPERAYNIFYVDDHTYGVSTLEMWGWHMVVDRDESYDFMVGNGEVYNLHAWPNNGGFGTYFVYFRPMVLPLTKEPSTRATIDSRVFDVTPIAPHLKPEDVTVRVNGTRVEIVSLQEIYETGLPANAARAMPAYLVQVRRSGIPANGKITVSVEYDATVTVKDQPVRVRSLGYTQFYNQFTGLSLY
jgi:hypothetical protein